MKSIQENVKSIIQLLLSMVLYLGLSVVEDCRLFIFILGTWTIFLLYRIGNKIFMNRQKAGYILFSTQNDQYYQISSLFFGILLVGGALTVLIMTNEADIALLAASFDIGILLTINGMLNASNGQIYIKNGMLVLSGLKVKPWLSDIAKVTIEESSIIVTRYSDEVLISRNLKLDANSARNIEVYLLSRTGALFLVENKLSSLSA